MASVFTHPAPALCLAALMGSGRISARLLVAGIVCSLLPDLDVLGFKLGISYGDGLGHRGFSHSLLFAFALGFLAALSAPRLRSGRLTAFLLCSFAVLSHILLDALTSGGLGVAAFWPWSEQRFFLPWRPIRVSPFSPAQFFSSRGLAIILSELRWVCLPCLGLAAVAFTARRLDRR